MRTMSLSLAAALCLTAAAPSALADEWRLDLPSNLSILGRRFNLSYAGPPEGAVITGLRADITLDNRGTGIDPGFTAFQLVGGKTFVEWNVSGFDFGWFDVEDVHTTMFSTDVWNDEPAHGGWEILVYTLDDSLLGGTLLNNSALIIEYEMPASGCAADLDDSGTVDVFDLLAYLDDWFAGAADRTDDGVTDIFDLLNYLDAWFAGCP